MFTDEPSTQQTELPTDAADLPEQRPNELIEPQDRPALTPPSPPVSPPWTRLLVAVMTWFGSVLLLLFVPAILAIPYLVYLWKTTGAVDVTTLTSDKTFVFISIAGIVPTHLLTLLLVWIVATEGRRRPFWKTVGFEWPQAVGPVAGAFACAAIAIVLLLIGFAVTHYWGGGKTQLDLLVESSIAARFATAFVAVVTAPLVEELVYRGLLYSAIERALGVAVAVGAVSLLFAGVHVFQYFNNIAVITVITVLSFTLTLVRAYTGKVLPSFVIHLVFNGIQSLFIVLSPFTGWGQSS